MKKNESVLRTLTGMFDLLGRAGSVCPGSGSPEGCDVTARSANLLMVGFFFASLILCIPGLRESLWYDEVWRTHTILFEFSFFHLLFMDCHNFLYNACMQGWIRIFGDSELSIRIPSLIMCYTSAFILQRWLSVRQGRLFSVIVFAWFVFSPFHIWYATEAKNNSMVMLFCVLIFVCYDALLVRKTSRAAWTAIGVSVLGLCTDFLLFLPLAAAWALLFVEIVRHKGSETRHLYKQVVLRTLLLISPLLLYKAFVVSSLFRSYLKLLDLEQLALFIGNFLSTGNALVPLHAYDHIAGQPVWAQVYYVGLAIAVAWLLCLGIRRQIRSRGTGFVMFFCVPLAAIFLLSHLVHLAGRSEIYLERSLGAVTFYFFGVLLVSGLVSLPAGRLRASGIALFLGINVLASVLMLTAYRWDWTVYKPNPDWRSVAASLGADDTPPRNVMAVGGSDINALHYYLHKQGGEGNSGPGIGAGIRLLPWRVEGKLPVDVALAEGRHVIHACRNIYWPGNFDELLRDLESDSRARLVARRNFSGVEMYTFSF